MASPHQLEYLAVGFLFSEGLINRASDLLDWEVTHLESAEQAATIADTAAACTTEPETVHALAEQLADYEVYVVNLVLNQRCHQRIQAQRRLLAGRTGCGMSGIAQALPDLSDYQQTLSSPPPLGHLLAIRQRMDSEQQAHLMTGAVHAAATVIDDELQIFEDVGRHNALDKLIGWQLRHKVELECVVMTSRLSIELVQKSIRAQVGWLVGMSAPTSTAVRTAERYGLGLAGFLRDNRVTYYTGYPSL
jgi:FdhD protein